VNPEFEHLEGNTPHTHCPICRGQLHDPCEKCGAIVHVGEWPFCPHGAVGRTHHEFEAYYDQGLGETITTRDQRRRLLKNANAYARDGLSKGDLSARMDKVKADRKQRGLDRRPTNPLYFY
jgi:hypothetical protein